MRLKPELEIVDKSLNDGDLPLFSLREVNFWTVNKNISIDPNECFFTLGQEDHVFIKHKISIMLNEFSGSVDDLEGNLERLIIRA
jgi:hypothetical protein